MPIIGSKVDSDTKLPFLPFWSSPMSHAAHIADLIDDLTDLSLAQAADLREFAQAAFSPPPIPVVAPNEFDLPEDN